MRFVGTWHITKMEAWDEDYYNMEVQAFIRITENNMGSFQFGLVSGEIDGEVEKNGTGEGKIKLHLGDSSLFLG